MVGVEGVRDVGSRGLLVEVWACGLLWGCELRREEMLWGGGTESTANDVSSSFLRASARGEVVVEGRLGFESKLDEMLGILAILGLEGRVVVAREE